MVTIIEKTAIPLVVVAFATAMEILVISSIKIIEAIEDIFGRMAMHDVKQDHDAHAVRGVNELLEIFRRTITTACRKEIVDLISEAGVISMFHDSHELDDIVTEILNPGQHISRELFISSNALLRRRDADVSLVDASTFGLLWTRVLELVLFRSGGIPKACVIDR